MNRGDAYQVLAKTLEEFRARGYDALAAGIGQPAVREIVRVGSEDVTVETTVCWADAHHGAVRVCAEALGPSCWNMERLEESIVVRRSATH